MNAKESTGHGKAEGKAAQKPRPKRNLAKALCAGDERFKSIFDESPIGIELYDADGLLMDANPACLRMLGVADLAQVKGFKLFEDPNLPDKAKAKLRRGKPVRYEAPFDFEKVKALRLYETSKSGIVHLDVLITPVGVKRKAAPQGYLVQVQDITERKRAENALVTSKAYTESIVQNFLDTLIVVDAEAKIQTVNPATCRLLGYTEEELKGQSVSMIFAEEEEEEEVKRVFQFFREPEKAETLRPQDTIRNRELTYKTKDGRLIPMLFNASILTDEMGNVTGVVAGAKDITEIKQAQETLRKTEERFRDVIENIFKFVPEGLLVLTDKLNVFRRNKALEDLVHQYAEKLNYTEDELADIINEQVKIRVASGEKADIRIPRNQK